MSLKLYTAPVYEPVTLTEAKAHLRVDVSTDDTYIGALITAAREACEHRIGRSLMRQTWELMLDEFPDGIRLDNPPTLAVVSVEYADDDGDYVTLSSDDYTVDSNKEPGWIVPAYGLTWPTPRSQINAVRVRYRSGYSDSATEATQQAAVPKVLKQWMLLAIGDMYLTREGSADKPALRHDFTDRLLDRHRIWGI